MSELAESLNGLPNFPFFKIFCSFTPLTRPRSPSKCNQFFIVPFQSSTYKISFLPVQNMLSNISQTDKPILSQDTQNLNLKHCCLETQTLTMWTILQLYWLCMITLKIQKGFSTIYLLIYNVYYFQILCKSTILGVSLYW